MLVVNYCHTAAAMSLKRNNPQAYETLCSTKLRFRYHDDGHDLLTERAIISRDPNTGDPTHIFFSGRLDSTPLASVEQVGRLLQNAYH